MPEAANNLRALRKERGIAAAALAAAAGVTRQAIYAIEAGTYIPNAALALKLAHQLQTTVEELFAAPEPATPCWLPDPGHRILLAGCDPAATILARHARAAGVELILSHRNSTQALALLRAGHVHIAGTHLDQNLADETLAVFSFALQEEGILTAAGNPKAIRGPEDFARSDLRLAIREEGSASRALLDTRLRALGIETSGLNSQQVAAQSHLHAASLLHVGLADCCIATAAAARLYGLHFIPLASEPYHLVVSRQDLALPGMQRLLETLALPAFRGALEATGGYDARTSGDRVL